MNTSTINAIEIAVGDWMERNPRQPRERRRQYARRAWQSVEPSIARPRRVGFDWTIFLPLILKIIEMIIERRRQ